ncbi:hypothetical protein [Mesorhizobium sp. M4B.F.Ca.ET.058.02.1.1]|uniref:hypothetical protein n=1 Tax=Mesorhizobium sp. M4B.F.Ca.ET.058.02.1.1 TaxID=2493675 RepID=UPI000F757D2B|nr:hypothetical protein [Mesorhizobium sp. M4B.F.Ca.ET.058.02.1.1]AZO48061.1 hypothetical protein EJ073_09710 [Mesorhizobium sp. M4B.F.Ca.ET.058.02.1.1]
MSQEAKTLAPTLSDDEIEDILEGQEPMEPMTVCIDSPYGNLVLPIAMMMDKFGNPTEIEYDTKTLLCGSAELGWYEIDVEAGSWVKPTLH